MVEQSIGSVIMVPYPTVSSQKTMPITVEQSIGSLIVEPLLRASSQITLQIAMEGLLMENPMQ